ncbi:MAG: gluconokinase [Acidobacteriaceae bacterium]|jgi:gluconokinase|nr:gluconokinase [Acidobacteriaceae bacterium]
MIILVMGIEGTGKTTVGRLLAERLHWDFADADDFHSAANKEKMKQGIPLADADRVPWLAAIREQIWRWIAAKKNGVITCSALKQSYRDLLLSPPPGQEGSRDEIKTVYLHGTYALIAERLHHRQGHFAGEALLASQFATLEEPKDAISIDVHQAPDQIVDEIMRRLNLA